MTLPTHSTLSLAIAMACFSGLSPAVLADDVSRASETLVLPDLNDIRAGVNGNAVAPEPEQPAPVARRSAGNASDAAPKPGDPDFVNQPPSFSHLSGPTVVKNSIAYSKSGWAFDLSDGDGDRGTQAMTFLVVANTNPKLFSDVPWVSYPDGTLHFTPARDKSGTAEIRLVLRDTAGTKKGGRDTSKEVTFTVTVLDKAVNQAPSFRGGGNVSVAQDSGQQELRGWARGMDDGDAAEQNLQFSVVAVSEPSLFSAQPSITPEGSLRFTPRDGKYGSADVTVVLRDDGGTEDGGQDTSQPYQFTLLVEQALAEEEENLAPVLSSQSIDVSAGQTGQLNLYGADADGDEISYRIMSAPRHGQASIQGDVLSYTAFENFAGLDTLEVVASDGTLESNRATIRVTVAGDTTAAASPAVYNSSPSAPSVNDRADTRAGASLSTSVSPAPAQAPIPVSDVATNASSSVVASASNVATSTVSDLSSTGEAPSATSADSTVSSETSAPQRVRLSPSPSVGSSASASGSVAPLVAQVDSSTISERQNTSTDSVVAVEAKALSAVVRADQLSKIPLQGSVAQTDSAGFRVVETPEHGTLRLVDGVVHYQPVSGYRGGDSFKYVRFDGDQSSEPASVSMWVDACYPSQAQAECLALSESLAGQGRQWDIEWAPYPLASAYSLKVEHQGQVIHQQQHTARQASLEGFSQYGDLSVSITPLAQGVSLSEPAEQHFAALSIRSPQSNQSVDALHLQFVGSRLAHQYRLTLQDPQGEAKSRLLFARDLRCESLDQCDIALSSPLQQQGRYTLALEALDPEGVVLSSDRVNNVELLAPSLSITLAQADGVLQVAPNDALSLAWQLSQPVAEFELRVQHRDSARLVLRERLSAASVCDASGLYCQFTLPEQAQSGEYEVYIEAVNIDGLSAQQTQRFVVSDISTVALAGRLNDTGVQISADGVAGNRSYCNGNDTLKQDCEYGRDALALSGELEKFGQGHAGFDFSKISADGETLPEEAREWHCVLDNHTGLMWEVKQAADQQPGSSLHDADDRFTWRRDGYESRNAALGGDQCHSALVEGLGSSCDTQGFVDAVNQQGLCGQQDWRLPNRDELTGLVDYSRYQPALDPRFFPSIGQGEVYWTASPASVSSNGIWQVDFTSGDVNWVNSASAGAVRLVRDAPASE